jgi:hypothetical protein
LRPAPRGWTFLDRSPDVTDVDLIESVEKPDGFVHSGPDFTKHTQVVDGDSGLLTGRWGDAAGTLGPGRECAAARLKRPSRPGVGFGLPPDA